MKKRIRITLFVICVVIGMNFLLIGCFRYAVDHRKTIQDTSVSPDGKYELTLIEIGEPVWPFGSASGRLTLKEGDNQINQADFELKNDGCSIGSDCWTVAWMTDYVEVVLSGDEQFDEQILLYFDGSMKRQTLDNKAESTTNKSHNNAPVDDPIFDRLEVRCEEIESLYHALYESAEKTVPDSPWDDSSFSQSSIDSIENLLYDAGYDVMDTNEPYPEYLTTSERFYVFWDAVQQNRDAEQEVITILKSGGLSYRLFTYDESGAFVYSMTYYPDEIKEPYYECHEIKDWELTEKGNFYYRIYPANDKHYPDFSLIRLAAPNTELFDLAFRYIYPAGYIATNIFLIDWQEGNWENLSFNDQFEYLYYAHHGKQFLADHYTVLEDKSSYAIPANEFEGIVLPYYNIDIETFQSLAQYHAEGDYYPWRPLNTNDFVKIWYYNIEPEVTAYVMNPDGTMTLTVQMLSTDLKIDCLFAHEVTVRPLENGNFQYVGNRITYQTEYGLPYSVPRLMWD